jgi:hypothetical protein
MLAGGASTIPSGLEQYCVLHSLSCCNNGEACGSLESKPLDGVLQRYMLRFKLTQLKSASGDPEACNDKSSRHEDANHCRNALLGMNMVSEVLFGSTYWLR